MSLFQFHIEESGWFVLACMLIAGLFSYLHYSKRSSDWSTSIHYTLATLRFVAVFLICFLLLSPFVKFVKNQFEKPAIALVIDNSSSINDIEGKPIQEIRNTTIELSSQLEKLGFDVSVKDLASNTGLDSIQFSLDETDLTKSLKNVKSDYFNQNLANIILISDGLNNQGIAPDNIDFNVDVFTIGIGDTTTKKDLIVNSIKANRTTYLNNSFPIKAQFQAIGYNNLKTKLSLSRNDTIISSKEVQFRNNSPMETIFYTSEQVVGGAKYTVSIESDSDEISTKNNSKSTFIEVVNNKSKILLYAQTPHPDIKLLKRIIDKSDQYELDVFIDGHSNKPLNSTGVHLIIVHQSPIKGVTGQFDKILTSDTPKLFIIGKQTNIAAFNKINESLQIKTELFQNDEVGAHLNTKQELFTLDESYFEELLPNAPPLIVPFGDYIVKGKGIKILQQKVGSIETEKPLLILNEGVKSKEGILLGEGLWRWNLYEFVEKGEQRLLTEVISKSIQFLISKDDKRQLVVTPTSQQYFTSEPVQINMETFNELHERIGNITTKLIVKSSDGKEYTFDPISNKSKTTFQLNYFPEGRYTYTAKANIAGKKHQANGSFTVERKNLESLTSRANFKRLQKIAINNNGIFTNTSSIQSIITEIQNRTYPKKIHSNEEHQPLRVSIIYLLIIITLLSTEWAIRKAKGNY